MTKLLQLFLMCLIFLSCNQQLKEKDYTLIGDWIVVRDTLFFYDSFVGYRCQENELIAIRNNWYETIGSYQLFKDSLFIELGDNPKKFKVLKHTNDSLFLQNERVIQKYYSRHLEYNKNLKFDELKIEFGRCFGDCPEFKIQVLDIGEVKFTRLNGNDIVENINFNLSQKDNEKLDSLFKWSYINNLDTTIYYGLVDDWPINLTIKYNNKETVKIKGTYWDMPYRLRDMIEILLLELRERKLI